MHPAHVVQVPGDHAWAVGSDDVAQLWHRELRAVLAHQPGNAEPAAAIAAVARDLQHGQAIGDLAEGEEADQTASPASDPVAAAYLR